MSTPGIRLLTGGDLEIDSSLGADLSGTLPRALFVALLLIGTGPVSREYLATQLWPESDAATGRQRLRMTLHKLRRGLGPFLEPALKTTPDSLSMNCAKVGVDIDAFQELSRRDTAAARSRAIALYGDNLLERFPPVSANFDEMLDRRRAEYRSTFLSLCRRALAEDIEAGDVTAYDRLLEKALRIERTNADLVADAMRFYGAAGSVQRVTETFDRHARALRADIDVEPEPEIMAIRDEMRALALDRIHARAPPSAAPNRQIDTAGASDSATTPAPRRSFSLGKLAGRAAAILAVAVAGVWTWRATTTDDRVLLLLPVAETPGSCGSPEARTVFDHATEAAVTNLKGGLVVLAGTNAPDEIPSAEVFTVARSVDCDGPNARGNLTVIRERNNEVFLLRRYDLRAVQEDALAEAITVDLLAALPP